MPRAPKSGAVGQRPVVLSDRNESSIVSRRSMIVARSSGVRKALLTSAKRDDMLRFALLLCYVLTKSTSCRKVFATVLKVLPTLELESFLFVHSSRKRLSPLSVKVRDFRQVDCVRVPR